MMLTNGLKCFLYQVQICIYVLMHTPLVLVNRTGAMQPFKLKKWGQTYKLRKRGASMQ